MYLLVIVLTTAQFLVFSLSYRKQNRASLISVILLIIVGISMQEILGGEFRTAYVALTMGVALMFIHYAEFYKMAADEQVTKQQKELMKDVLSGVLSRYAYTKAIDRYSDIDTLPDDFTVFVLDINGLKTVNDTVGHDAGDELIIGAARCIEKAFGSAGLCYRTGGDEFVVMTNMSKEETESALLRLQEETKLWSRDRSDFSLNIAAGYPALRIIMALRLRSLQKKPIRLCTRLKRSII